jgi:hypothetical protein
LACADPGAVRDEGKLRAICLHLSNKSEALNKRDLNPGGVKSGIKGISTAPVVLNGHMEIH